MSLSFSLRGIMGGPRLEKEYSYWLKLPWGPFSLSYYSISAENDKAAHSSQDTDLQAPCWAHQYFRSLLLYCIYSYLGNNSQNQPPFPQAVGRVRKQDVSLEWEQLAQMGFHWSVSVWVFVWFICCGKCVCILSHTEHEFNDRFHCIW